MVVLFLISSCFGLKWQFFTEQGCSAETDERFFFLNVMQALGLPKHDVGAKARVHRHYDRSLQRRLHKDVPLKDKPNSNSIN